jgi:rhamnulokinase
MKVFLAVDLGAGSGRVIAGEVGDSSLRLREIHRFDNPGTDLPGGSFWNLIGLFREIQEGLRLAAGTYGSAIVSIGIDTWGVDFGLLDARGRLLGMPHQYRDPRHEGMPEKLHALMPEAEIYRHSGITTNFYNSSLQLLAEKERQSPALLHAERLLFVPDILGYWLSGRAAVERTIASTSQLLDAASGDWCWEIIDAMGLPRKLFGEIVPPGTILGSLRDEVRRVTGLGEIPVVASACHDTASAVAGIPLEGENQPWLSSGTWSIMGLETREPIRSEAAFQARCCNEQGVDGTVRFLKNISGLWLIQECRRQWALEGQELSYAEMARMADAAEAFTAFIDPDAPEFAAPDHMPERIRNYCREHGQAVPESAGQILRVVTESLALKYRVTLQSFQELSGTRFNRLCVGGGGIQNESLVQATADACGVEVVAGPTEATSCGNLITQMIATGHLTDLAAGRRLIRNPFDFATYQPQGGEAWTQAAERFRKLI